MKKIRTLVLGALCAAVAFSGRVSCSKGKGEPSPTNMVSKFRNVIYTYTLGDVMYPEMYTHVIISFFRANGDGDIYYKSFPHTKETVKKFKKEHPFTKVMAALGGGSYSDELTPAMLDEDARTNLANQLAKFMEDFDLDGLDLDENKKETKVFNSKLLMNY